MVRAKVIAGTLMCAMICAQSAEARTKVFVGVVHITEAGQTYAWSVTSSRKVYVAKAPETSGNPTHIVIRTYNRRTGEIGAVKHRVAVNAGQDIEMKSGLGDVHVEVSGKPYSGAYVHVEKD